MIIIAGLGAGALDDLPFSVYKLLKDSSVPKYIRTEKHPVVENLVSEGLQFKTFDFLYEQLPTFADVYRNIAQSILSHQEDVIYCVPGHPMVAEESVHIIVEEARRKKVAYKIIPAVSFLDHVFTSLRIDPVEGLSLIDALQIEGQLPILDRGNVITQVYDQRVASEVKLTLMDYYPDDFEVMVLRALGIEGQEKIERVPLYEIDRIKWLDYLTTLYVPPFTTESEAQCNYPLDPLVQVMEKLRSEEGCPWDREQTHESLRKYLLEEAYEVVEAIDEGDMSKLQEELGDLMLQIVFHSQIAAENEYFDINDAIMEIKEKLIRRHPHVFGDLVVNSSEQVTVNWEKIKTQEKKAGAYSNVSVLAGITKTLPALMKSEKIQKKAAQVGFDWPSYHGALDKVQEELKEVIEVIDDGGDKDKLEEELGDLLFATVNLARFFKINPEEALDKTSAKFMARFWFVEEEIRKRGLKLEETTLEIMDEFWNMAKSKKMEQNS